MPIVRLKQEQEIGRFFFFQDLKAPIILTFEHRLWIYLETDNENLRQG